MPRTGQLLLRIEQLGIEQWFIDDRLRTPLFRYEAVDTLESAGNGPNTTACNQRDAFE
jgi:hypothetical protein